MATSPDFVRIATGVARPLAETAFDALRDAVLVVDARAKHRPVVLANVEARRCLLASVADELVDVPLYSLLGVRTDPLLDGALAGDPGIVRTQQVDWRCRRGVVSLATTAKVLPGDDGSRMVMLTFTGPAEEPALLSAIEQLPLNMLILDRRLIVTYANAGAIRTAGGPPLGILGFSALTLLPTAAIPRSALQGALLGHHYHEDALVVEAAGQPRRWFEVDVQPLKDAAGVVGLAVLANEISSQDSRVSATADSTTPAIAMTSNVSRDTKSTAWNGEATALDGSNAASRGVRTRGSPTESERRLFTLTEHARDIITVAGADGQLQYISGGITNSLGYTAAERRAHSLFEHVHPDDVDTIRAQFAQLVRGAISSFSQQFRIRHKNGSYRWLESNYVSALDNPLVKGVVVNSRDITERRQVESQLAQREEVFRLAADAVSGIIFEWDLERHTVECSRGLQDVLGLEAHEVAREGDWSLRVHPQDAMAYQQTTADALRNGKGWTATYRVRDSRNQYLSMLERGLIQRDDSGQPVRAIGCCVDVSEINRLTDLLAETQRAARMGGWEFSFATGDLTWTDELFRILETTPQAFAVSRQAALSRCTPESRRRFIDACVEAKTDTGYLEIELEINTLKNQRLWVRVIAHIESMEGRPVRAYGSAQNIHAQKLAQIALENSTDWLKLSMSMAHMHAWRWERDSDELEFAIVDGQMVYLPRAYPGMKQLFARVHPQDATALRRSIDGAFAAHTDAQHEFRLKSRDGKYRSYAAVARPMYDANHQPSGMVGVTQDVTARYESAARVRRSEELLRVTTANTADTLVLTDTELKVRFINRGTPRLTIEEIIGRDIAVLLPEPARAAVTTRLRRMLASTEAATYEFDLVESGAQTQYFESRAVLVRDAGVNTGLSITMRNITERKRLEREILDVSNRERQTIGRDLHDGLGQELTGVALMLRGLATRIRKQCPDVVDQVNEIVGLVNQSIETARSLARGLLPVNTETGGLGFALRALADRSRDVYGFDVEFAADVDAEVPLGETNASHLYRIAQEALTNAARHGNASHVAMSLSVNKTLLVLQIADDGIGIGEKGRFASGLGLKIMTYRASMIGARIEIVPNHPHGTIVRVTGEQSPVTSTLQSSHAIQGEHDGG